MYEGVRGVSEGGRWLVRPPPLSRLEVLPSVLPHFPLSGARVRNPQVGQDDRDVPTQSCPDKRKPRQG